jgi:DNA polymerase V
MAGIKSGESKSPSTQVVRLPLPVATLARRLANQTLRAGDINGFLDVEARTQITVPLVGANVACGFPSPADDYLDRPLDFNELLIENQAATFAVRVSGESMTGAGIFPGDIAVVDRARTPANNCIVLALVDGEFTLKRYCVRSGRIVLQAENKAFQDILIEEHTSFEVWGVVTRSIRMF